MSKGMKIFKLEESIKAAKIELSFLEKDRKSIPTNSLRYDLCSDGIQEYFSMIESLQDKLIKLLKE